MGLTNLRTKVHIGMFDGTCQQLHMDSGTTPPELGWPLEPL